MNDLLNNSFYLEIEQNVREWVFWLRNAGINTICSCHHEGYIQCETSDPTTEIMRIKIVMMEHKVEDFTITVHVDGILKHSHLEIKSLAFIKSEGKQ